MGPAINLLSKALKILWNRAHSMCFIILAHFAELSSLCRSFWKFLHRVKLRRPSCTCSPQKLPECNNVLVVHFNPLPRANCSHQAQENLKLIALYVYTTATSSSILCLIGHLASQRNGKARSGKHLPMVAYIVSARTFRTTWTPPLCT